MSPESRPQSSNLDEPAKHLFSIISHPFERDFDPNDTVIRLELPIAAHNSTDNSSLQDQFRTYTGQEITTGNWEVELAYDRGIKTLGVSEVSIPIKDFDPLTRIVFRKLPHYGFAVLREDSDTSEPVVIETPPEVFENDIAALPDNMTASFYLNSKVIIDMLDKVGYDFGYIFTDPQVSKLLIAQLMDQARVSKMSERIVKNTDPRTRIILERVTQLSEMGEANEKDTEVTASLETYRADTGERNQLRVTFQGNDHFVDIPEITTVRRVPDTQSVDFILTADEPICREFVSTVPVSAEFLDRIAVRLIDDLTPRLG